MPQVHAHEVRGAAAWTSGARQTSSEDHIKRSMAATSSRCEFLVSLRLKNVNDDEAYVELLVHALKQNGLHVMREGRYLLASCKGDVLAREAHACKLVKTRRADGRVEVFVDRDGARLRYELDQDGCLFSRAEEAFLLERACTGATMESAPEGLGARWKKKRQLLPPQIAQIAEDSLIEALKRTGCVEDTVMLGTIPKMSWWAWLASPTTTIHRAFGSDIGLYFAWMNFFQLWLLVPAALGAYVYHLRVEEGVTIDDDRWASAYALAVCLWAALFCKFWARRENQVAVDHGDVLVEADAATRPGFRGTVVPSPVTGKLERYSPPIYRVVAYLVSIAVTGLMLYVALLWHVVSLNLQGYITKDYVHERSFYREDIARYAEEGEIFDPKSEEWYGLQALVPTLIHVIVVRLLNFGYSKVASLLTEIENHETQSAHTNALLVKRFIFEAVDAYAGLVFLGFVRRDAVRLRQELIAIYCVDTARRVLQEALLPLVLTMLTTLTTKKATGATKKHDNLRDITLKKAKSSIEERAEKELRKPIYEPFDDYLEMVIEFGYVCFFASVFPLGAVLSFAANFVEVRSDLFKILYVYRRPSPKRARSIGAWAVILRGMVYVAIASNAFLFAFGSEQMVRWFPQYFDRVSLRKAGFSKDYAKRVARDGGERSAAEALQGQGRVVVLVAVALEHLVVLACVLVELVVPSLAAGTRVAVGRLVYERDRAAA